MDCFAACSRDGITKVDLDRFTDKIENVLSDEKGRRLFHDYMYTSKMRDGIKSLNFYDHIERLLAYKDDVDSATYRSFLRDVDKLIDEAERIEELDFSLMERLTEVRDGERKEDIIKVLKLLKTETVKTMRRQYSKFRNHYVPNK